MKRLSFLILFLAACATAPQAPIAPAPIAAIQSAQPVHVIIVSTTDRHGWYDSHHDSRTAPPYGGLPLMGGYLQNLRANHEDESSSSTPAICFRARSNRTSSKASRSIKGYNALGYSAAAVGNHEFDYGPVGPDSVARLRRPGSARRTEEKRGERRSFRSSRRT